jgi:DNA processing protein
LEKDLRFKIALTFAEGVGGIMFRHLVAHFGSAEAVLSAPTERLIKMQGIGHKTASQVKKSVKFLEQADTILGEATKQGVRLLSYQSAGYPQRLKSLYDCPPILYSNGTADFNALRTVGIVGTRNATEAGKEVTRKIVEGLAKLNVTVVSGLAYGIDIEAHRAAIQNDLPTIAVLANGIDVVYPAVHRKYIPEILNNGGLLTESSFGMQPIRQQFLARNRIIAGLSDAVVVVESAAKGGSLVTAEFANNYHREVFAVPGAIDSKFSEGTNTLIKRNKAQIFTGVKDIIEQLNWDIDNPNARASNIEKEIDWSRFSDDESKVLRLLHEKTEMLIDNLSFESGVPLNRLAALLLNLEFQDLVKVLPGKKFRLR